MQQRVCFNIITRKQCNKEFALTLTRKNNVTKSLLEYYHEKTIQQRVCFNINTIKQCNKEFALILTRENDATKSLLEY